MVVRNASQKEEGAALTERINYEESGGGRNARPIRTRTRAESISRLKCMENRGNK